MTLIEPVRPPRVDDLGSVHFIAIGGVGMSGVALGFLERGVGVSGSDHVDSSTLARLREKGATVWVGHDASHIAGADAVVVSTAVRSDNVELMAARKAGLPIFHRSTALSALMDRQVVVAVAGTHGKTTTSAMCVAALQAVGDDVSYVVGATLVSSGTGSHMGKGRYFVVEADESDGSFRQYPARIAVVTCVEADHLDNWGTPERYLKGFEQFVSTPTLETLIVNADDPGANRIGSVAQALGKSVLTYGRATTSSLRISDVDVSGPTVSAVVNWQNWSLGIRLPSPGVHVLYDACAALLAGLALGEDPQLLIKGLEGFGGTDRRFQRVGVASGVAVVDDYAHHPTEVAATLSAARAANGHGRIIACFQPHLYTRTRDFAREFGEALLAADVSVVVDIYPAREDPIPGVTSQLIVDAIRKRGGDVSYVPDLDDLPSAVVQIARAGDLVLTIGAGSITTAAPRILGALEES